MELNVFMDSIWQDILGVGLIAIIALFLYMRAKHKTFNEVIKDLREAFTYD